MLMSFTKTAYQNYCKKTAISLSCHSIKHLKFSSTRQQNRAKSPPSKANHISSTRGQNCKRQVDTADQVMAARPRMAWRRCAQWARSCSVGTKEGLQPMPRRCAGGSGTWNVADASKELNPVKYFVGCWTDVGGCSSGQEYRRLQRSHCH